MVKKVASVLLKSKKKIVKKLKKPSRIMYFSNPNSHIPHDVMPTYSFHDVFEHYLRNKVTVVPLVEKPISWKLLVRYNPELKRLRDYIVELEGRDFPEKAWDRVAKNIVEVLQSQHEWYKF